MATTAEMMGEHFFTVAARFAPQINFVARLSAIAERVQRDSPFPHWSSNAQYYDFFTKDNLLHLRVDHQRAFVQARSINAWDEFKDKGIQMLVDIVAEYGLADLKAFEYRRNSLLDIGMSWSEMTALGLDGMITTPGLLLDDPNDWSLTLVRDRDDEEVRMVVAPMNRTMATNQAKEAAGVTVMHDPAWSKNLSSLIDAIDGDRLFVQFSVISRNPSRHDLERIFRKAEEDSIKHVDRAVRKLKNQV